MRSERRERGKSDHVERFTDRCDGPMLGVEEASTVDPRWADESITFVLCEDVGWSDGR